MSRVKSHLCLVLAVVLAAPFLTGVAHADGSTAITGTVVDATAGLPVAGADVVAVSNGELAEATTDVDGHYSIDPAPAGTLAVSVHAVTFAGAVSTGHHRTEVVNFSLTPATFTSLPVYAGSPLGGKVYPDASTPGVFYMGPEGSREIYRTTDFGGRWEPVTMGYDDPVNGLPSGPPQNVALATGSQPGEVATYAYGTVSYSTDFGVTWKAVANPYQGIGFDNANRVRLFWRHVGSTNVLLVVHGTDEWRADMNAAAPALVARAAYALAGEVLDVADGADAPYVGVVATDGTLKFAPLTPSDDPAFDPSMTTAGFPASPVMLRLGGHIAPVGPPDAALVVSDAGAGNYTAVVATKNGASSFNPATDLSPATPVLPTSGPACNLNDPAMAATGSLAPTSGGSTALGNVASCAVQKVDGSSALVFTNAGVMQSDWSYDAGYDGATNEVIFASTGGRGPVKSVSFDGDGLPQFDPNADATDATGGMSVNGIDAPVITDTSYGPEGSNQVAVSVSNSGGSLALASVDGGQSFVQLATLGGNANAWWSGASGHEWLLFGHMGQSPLLTAAYDWNGGATTPGPNVDNSLAADLGADPTDQGYSVNALAGIPGTDEVFVGSGTFRGVGLNRQNGLERLALTPGNPVSATRTFDFASAMPLGATLYQPHAMAYCPATADDPDVRDVLFVGTGDFDGVNDRNAWVGSLLRITGASTGSPVVSVVATVPHDVAQSVVTDVRADCATGIVYAGSRVDGNSLFRSVDGGLTFTSYVVPSANGGPFTQVGAIGLDPSNANDITVADVTGELLHSDDGGADWTVLNDPNTGRSLDVHDIEFPPPAGGGAPSPDARTLMRASASLFAAGAGAPAAATLGTSTGALEADVQTSAGIVDQLRAAGRTSWVSTKVSGLARDSAPAITVDGANARFYEVHVRPDGLYLSVNDQGSWSPPAKVPGTLAGDTAPALAFGSGSLHLAFTRATGTWYAMRRANAWSAVQRVSASGYDNDPAIAAVPGSRPYVWIAVARRGAGIYSVTNRTGRWSVAARITGTTAADAASVATAPSVAIDTHGYVHVAFARASGTVGVYYATQAPTGAWSSLQRLSTLGGDGDASLAVDSAGHVSVAFRRNGSSPGVYLLRKGTPTWTGGRLAGTSTYDVSPSLSWAAVAGRSTWWLTFRKSATSYAGVYLTSSSTGLTWGAAQRRSRSSTDRAPVAAVAANGAVHVVFDRG